MEFIVLSLINGILYGLLLFMLSSGLTLIFGMMGVLNFAHASLYMLGAYFAYQISGSCLGFWPAFFLSPIFVGIIGSVIEKYGLRTVHKYGHMHELLFTFGLSYLIIEIVQLVWGKLPVDYKIPESMDFTLFNIYSAGFHFYKAFMMVVAISIFAVLYLLFKKTRIGMIVQASLHKPVMVAELGHNVPLIFMCVFSLGCMLAGVAGVISGNLYITEPMVAERLGLIIFVVVIVGGLGSLTGAFIASILIGVITFIAAGIDYSAGDFLRSMGMTSPNLTVFSIRISQTAETLPFLLMILVLIFRPKGIMGVRES